MIKTSKKHTSNEEAIITLEDLQKGLQIAEEMNILKKTPEGLYIMTEDFKQTIRENIEKIREALMTAPKGFEIEKAMMLAILLHAGGTMEKGELLKATIAVSAYVIANIQEQGLHNLLKQGEE
jgi:hypothetical protein